MSSPVIIHLRLGEAPLYSCESYRVYSFKVETDKVTLTQYQVRLLAWENLGGEVHG